MYKINRTIPLGDKQEIEIAPFGDLHLGNKNCRLDKFKRFLKWAQEKDNVYLIGMGDLLECILPSDPRFESDDVYETLDDLREELIQILEPVKDKIITLLQGNHEHKLKKSGYGCPIKYISKKLGVRYGGLSAYIKLKATPKTHRRSLIVWTHHGWFSGRKRGSKVNNLEDNLAYYDADVYLCGHSHDLWATRKSRIHWGGSRDVIFANTGSFVETATIGTTNYSERANYPPQKLGVVKVIWRPYDEKIYVSE